MIVFPEFGGATALALLENAVEVAEVIEAAGVGDLGNRMGTVDQHSRCIPQTMVDDILTKVTARVEFEESTVSRGAHAGNVGYLSETDILFIMLIDVVTHFLHPTTVAGYLDLGKTG